MKKILYIVLSIIVLICFHLSIRYIINENFINKYKDGNYDSNSIDILKLINYPESYIVYFNKGDNYYRKQEYKNAQNEFEKALKKAPEDKVCIVTNNLSLSMLQQVDFTEEGWDLKLIEVEKVLLKDDCATKDFKGRNKDSQELYNEIEYVLNNAGQGDGDGDDSDEPQPDDNEDPEPENLEEQLQQQQEEAAGQREDDLEGIDWDFTTGNTFVPENNDNEEENPQEEKVPLL